MQGVGTCPRIAFFISTEEVAFHFEWATACYKAGIVNNLGAFRTKK
jgi:hypothetical protein